MFLVLLRNGFLALWPIFLLIFLFSVNYRLFPDMAPIGGNQISITFVVILMILYTVFWKRVSSKLVFKEVKKGILLSKDSCLILLVVGTLISTWMISGVVPSMVFYGLKMISPSYFLPTVALVSAIISLATGSSWASVGTVGVAFIGIGDALLIPQGLTAGAIVSGAFLGDKLSPLSDTNNLSSSVTGVNLLAHIRYMLYSNIPAFILSLLIFYFLGNLSVPLIDYGERVSSLTLSLETHFSLGPHLFLLPFMMGILILRRASLLSILITGVIGGVIFALLFQPQFFQEKPYLKLVETALYGHKLITSNEELNQLINRGGIFSFAPTLIFMIMAMVLGQMLKLTGSLNMISKLINYTIKGVGPLIFSTMSCGVLFNITTSDVYLSIVLTGKIFEETFKEFNLHPKNLSRALQDAATSTSPLIPWNTGGLYVSSVLGVSTCSYFYFAFFNLIGPLFSIALAFLNHKIAKASGDKIQAFQEEKNHCQRNFARLN